jgi:hypothetical protein
MVNNGNIYEGEFTSGGAGTGKITYAKGGIYQGSWAYNLNHCDGTGVMELSNGLRCEGTWQSMSGEGKVFSEDDGEYSGTFQYDGFPITGKGTLNILGWKMNATWENNIATGTLLTNNGQSKYEGTWNISWGSTLELIDGQGSFQSKDGNVFSGTWVDRNGKGSATILDSEWNNGRLLNKTEVYLNKFTTEMIQCFLPSIGKLTTGSSVFEGRWSKNGIICGKGAIECEGNIYEGEWVEKNEETTGTGTITYPNGKQFVGSWSGYFSRRAGKGTFLREGLYYTGEIDGSGAGTGIIESGKDYTNVWEGNWTQFYYLDNGKGKIEINGLLLEGEWVDGRGKGKITSLKDGSVLQNAEFSTMYTEKIYQIKGEGTIWYNGNHYAGVWNVYSGYGTITYPDGSKYHGSWDLEGQKTN